MKALATESTGHPPLMRVFTGSDTNLPFALCTTYILFYKAIYIYNRYFIIDVYLSRWLKQSDKIEMVAGKLRDIVLTIILLHNNISRHNTVECMVYIVHREMCYGEMIAVVDLLSSCVFVCVCVCVCV